MGDERAAWHPDPGARLKMRYTGRLMGVWLSGGGRKLRLLHSEAAGVARALRSPGGAEMELASGAAVAALRSGGRVGLRVLFAPGDTGPGGVPRPRVGDGADFVAWLPEADAERVAKALESLHGAAPIPVDAVRRGGKGD